MSSKKLSASVLVLASLFGAMTLSGCSKNDDNASDKCSMLFTSQLSSLAQPQTTGDASTTQSSDPTVGSVNASAVAANDGLTIDDVRAYLEGNGLKGQLLEEYLERFQRDVFDKEGPDWTPGAIPGLDPILGLPDGFPFGG